MTNTSTIARDLYLLKKRHAKDQRNFKRIWQANELLVERNTNLEKKVREMEAKAIDNKPVINQTRDRNVKAVFCPNCPKELSKKEIQRDRCDSCGTKVSD
jgi:hypothetical protein